MTSKKRKFIAAAAVLSMVFVVGCSSNTNDEPSTTSDAPAESASGSIEIGIIAPITGPLAAASEDLQDGWEAFWEQRGDTTVAGREVNWRVVDDANDPATGVTQAKALVDSHDIKFVVGPVTTAVGAAVGEELSRSNIPLFVPVLSDDNVTQRSPISGMVRIAGWTASQVTHTLGAWTADAGYKNAVTLCFDMAFGYEHCGGFVNTFTDKGGVILQQLWQQLGEQDYGAFFTQIRQADPDVVFIGTSGSDSVRFLQAWNDFGMDAEYPLVVTETVTDQSNLRSMGSDALGIISAGHYAEGLDEQANDDFVKFFEEKYSRLPSYFAAAMYTAALWLVEGIEAVDGNVEDSDAFIDAVKSVKLESSPLGSLSLDEYDHTTQDIYIREVAEREDGVIWNEVKEVIPQVSQFWEYDPEEYLTHPAYSRDYQGDGVWPEPAK